MSQIKLISQYRHEQINLVPRPPPRLYLAAVAAFLHGCEIKSGWRPGYEVMNRYG